MNPTPPRDEVFVKIQQIATTLLMRPVDEVTPDSRLVEDLGADSLFITQLILTLEDEFGVETDETDTEHFVTIGNVTDYVVQKLGSQ
jgi:acyl carrier protein